MWHLAPLSRLFKFSYFFRKMIEIERHFVIGFNSTENTDASVLTL